MAKKEELEKKKEEEENKNLQNGETEEKGPSVDLEKQTGKGKKKEEEENIKVTEMFKDKYNSKVIYNVGDIFVKDSTLTDKKPVKEVEGKYKVSAERYEELKRSLYVD